MGGKKMKSILSVVLAITMVVTASLTGIHVQNVKADEVDATQTRKAELEQENAELTAQLESAKQNTNDAATINQAYQNKVDVVVEQINNTNASIQALNIAIGENTNTINERQAEIDSDMEKLEARIRTIYMAGETTTLDILLGATDVNDFLDKASLITTLSDHDQQLIDNINASISKLEQEKVQLALEQDQLEQANADLQPQKDELQQLLDESGIQLSNAQTTEGSISNSISANEEEISELSSQIEAYYAAQAAEIEAQIQQAREENDSSYNDGGNDDVSGGDDGGGYVPDPTPVSSGILWPCPGYTYITSPFGDMDERSTPHTGIDISGGNIYGAAVIAADSGVVDYSWYSNGGWGGGYGTYCMINHGGGFSTLYAHMCDICVSPGEYVEKGQVIGHVGSTGSSTGPHLHFECRQNGVPYDPMSEF